MKKRSLTLFVTFSIVIIILTACQKNLTHPEEKNKELSNTPLPGQTTYCRISSIWTITNEPMPRLYLFKYDEYENPIYITAPTFLDCFRTFRYDKWHRLREFSCDFGSGFFDFWHFYGYDQQGRIGYDTVYIGGQKIQGQPKNYVNRYISRLEYDEKNRIIRTATLIEATGTETVTTAQYDAAGNLVRPYAVTYDNKVNLHRTNDIWMFIARDYSMNNAMTADAYNSAGFPTVVNYTPRNDPFAFNDIHISISHAQIGYECRPASW